MLLINLQPTEAMDHATFDTGQWLAYCGACPLPEMANAFLRAGCRSGPCPATWRTSAPGRRSPGGSRPPAYAARLRHGRHGLMGHLYPGMLDVSTDLTLVTANFGGHVEVLEFDDLRVRVAAVTDDAGRRADASWRGASSTLDDSVQEDGLRAGPPGSPSAWTRWSMTSAWTASPTTTAGSRASSTNGSARA